MSAYEAQETHEKIEEAAEGEHAQPHRAHPGRKASALLISVLAALLAIVEMGANVAQTEAVAANIEASNLWAFFQAKTIRKAMLQTAADTLGAVAAGDKADKLAAEWRATAERYEDDPDTGEGRKQLSERAKAATERHDRNLAAYHLYDYAAGALQIAIVLASAAVVTGVWALSWTAGGLGLVGIAIAALGLFAPMALHF